MRHHEKEFPIGRMAKVMGVSRSGYYHFLIAEPSAREQENKRLVEKIRLIHQTSYETYEVLVSMLSLKLRVRLVPENALLD